jgi:enoyl-[acyl-carrier-protein] reductase (NADH)
MATAFLAHDAARLITGNTLYVDVAITSSIDGVTHA